MYRIVPFTLLGILTASVIASQNETQREARCFQYTWLGPRFNNGSIFRNNTCQDATQLASGVPCFRPLVVSEDGSWPDVQELYRDYGPNVTCKLADSDVCGTYTYYFNGHFENSTHMCTRAITSQHQAITSGCYTQTSGSYVTRACFCRSIPGGFPCNNSVTTALSSSLLLLPLMFVLKNVIAHDLFNK